ncbi:MAG TPA: hypothetical protein VKA48_12760 [Gammaproteobacteria bacterium]|nr:hypothetical protein [Gammaproteobacteria bacterium]
MEVRGVSDVLRTAALAAGLFLVAQGVPEAAFGKERVGYAYSLDNGELLYKELHETRAREGRPATGRVTYRDTDGRVIAEKTLDYRENPLAPDFHLHMPLVDYQEGLRTSRGAREVYYQPASGEKASREVPVERRLVADAGFDRLIEGRLDDLSAGDPLTFDFLVPSRLEAYAFQAVKAGETEIRGKPAVHVRLEPANPFFRLIAGGVDVFYHRESGKLLRYKGLSNLRDADGNNLRVQVEFARDGKGLPEQLSLPAEPEEPGDTEYGPRVR